jgi:PKD domain
MRRAAVLAVLLFALLAASAQAAAPATFRAGAASASIDPPVPVYAGGFGLSPPLTTVHDPLEVRAFYVSNGRRSVAIAVVDAQAYFAAYQEGPGYGISSAREDAAKQIGGGTKASDIIVQATHSHAAATLEGIWGPVPPRYLQLVHDRTVQALADAARSARPARLQWATVDAPDLDNIDVAQTDSYSGWVQDGQISVLRALDAADGVTIGSFTSVPAHGDIVNGAGLKLLSADYFGFVRHDLDAQLGGVNVVGPATLGREETPVQTNGLDDSRWFATVVTSLVDGALGHARWVTDPTLASSEQLLRVPGTNAALLGLVAANHAPDSVKQQIADAGGIYPIDRADTPPYLTGNVIGTPLTALRIGPLAFLSMPGEPFPEVRLTIAGAVRGASRVIALSKGQDDLGYFYPAFVYPFTATYDSDHHTYNVAPQAGDQVIQGQFDNLAALGFGVDRTVAKPLPNRYEQGLRPGVQALAAPPEGDAGADGTLPVTLQGIYGDAAFGGADLDGPLRWDFGDGTTGTSGSEKRFVHAYAPGRYTVTVTATDTRGREARWSLPVRVHPRLRVTIERRGDRLAGAMRGGKGPALAWTWRLPDGRTTASRTVRARAATLTVTDATGTVASATSAP